ncbi:hypothetical protein SNE40_012129 [Patella caerulea]|uniref:DUF8040 domain-containing protein n=1 Tax=Patella caerulea TaxID=87958 RepID=A0AAN8JPR4_PATCE
MKLGRLEDSEWHKNFRMSKQDFQKLANELQPFIAQNTLSPNYTALSVEKKLAIILYTLNDIVSFAMTANSFGVSFSTIIVQVCRAITFELSKVYLKLPRNVHEMQAKTTALEVKFGMTQAFGCVDGKHIAIKHPVKNPQDYFCYKNFFSLSMFKLFVTVQDYLWTWIAGGQVVYMVARICQSQHKPKAKK